MIFRRRAGRHLLIALLASAPVAEAQPAPPRFRLVEEIRVNGAALDINPPIFFVQILNGGHMVAAEAKESRLRFFDATGRPTTTFGRPGGGPGEFGVAGQGSPASIWGGTSGDSLWVYDGVLRRLTVLRHTGEVVRIASPRHPDDLGPTSPLTAFGPQALLPNGTMLGPGLLRTSAPTPQPAIVVTSADGTWLRTLAMVPPRTSVRFTRGTLSIPIEFIPHAYHPLTDVASNGSRFAFVTFAAQGAGVQVRLTVISPEGDTLVARDVPAPARPIPARTADSLVNQVIERLLPSSGGPPPVDAATLRALRSTIRAGMPQVYPPFSRLEIGTDNSFWLERTVDRPGVSSWLVLDERGNPAGEVEFPTAGRRLARASRTLLWLIETDDDGFESVVRYRVTR